jgi:DNA-binding IclR family transcriptional regulator
MSNLPEQAYDDGSDRYTVPGLERGLRLLCEFSRHEKSLSAPELAKRLDVPRSTVFRLLATLERMGSLNATRAAAISDWAWRYCASALNTWRRWN